MATFSRATDCVTSFAAIALLFRRRASFWFSGIGSLPSERDEIQFKRRTYEISHADYCGDNAAQFGGRENSAFAGLLRRQMLQSRRAML
jgi:hypothetical protein